MNIFTYLFTYFQNQFTVISKVIIFSRTITNERKYRSILEKNVAEKKAYFNHDVKWLKQLESIYFSNVTPKSYDINLPLANQIISS